MKTKLYFYSTCFLAIILCHSSCTEDEIIPVDTGNQVTVSTNIATSITTNSVLSGGVIEGSAAEISARGICWSTAANPTIANSKLAAASGGYGNFTISISGLNPSTKYYSRAFATTPYETIYGEERQFTTIALTLATVTTNSILDLTVNSASSGGNVTSTGGGTVSARGICWSTTTNPTISNSRTINGSGAGSFTASMTTLTHSTRYYVRAYATNQLGTSYGAQQQFNTLSIVLPTVTTSSITSIARTSATAGGSVTSDGGGTVTERGLCYSTLTNPTILSTKRVVGAGEGSFSTSLSSLSANTRYYVRAYAINEIGVSYGVQQQFNTTL
ncbi:MAG: hypothetical protein V4721_03240 [Bacteroidota bacterium]